MTEDKPPLNSPALKAHADDPRAARLAREAAALRDNLRRRKQQKPPEKLQQTARQTSEPTPRDPPVE